MTSSSVRVDLRRESALQRRSHPKTQVFLVMMAFLWLVPLAWTIFTSLRPQASTDKFGYFSLHGAFNFDNFRDAWSQGRFPLHLLNSLIITVPTVIVTLFLAAMMAFAVSRFSWRFNTTLLILFTAGNLLPPQVLAAPLFVLYKYARIPHPFSDSGNLLDTFTGVIIVDIACQMGFCTFVLSNYMKALPHGLTEAALMDGAGPWRQFRSIVVPLCRPAIAALATLLSIWVYNDFFWPLLFIQSSDRLPVTTAINSLQSVFLQNYNLLAAGALITLIPTLVVYLVLQRQFVAGLTLGSDKG